MILLVICVTNIRILYSHGFATIFIFYHECEQNGILSVVSIEIIVNGSVYRWNVDLFFWFFNFGRTSLGITVLIFTIFLLLFLFNFFRSRLLWRFNLCRLGFRFFILRGMVLLWSLHCPVFSKDFVQADLLVIVVHDMLIQYLREIIMSQNYIDFFNVLRK